MAITSTGTQTSQLAAMLAQRPMSRLQIFAVAVSVALNALDGFDVLAITFAAPGIARDWGIGPAQLGVALSSGLVGMALGSLLLAPFGDRHGRRRRVGHEHDPQAILQPEPLDGKGRGGRPLAATVHRHPANLTVNRAPRPRQFAEAGSEGVDSGGAAVGDVLRP